MTTEKIVEILKDQFGEGNVTDDMVDCYRMGYSEGWKEGFSA